MFGGPETGTYTTTFRFSGPELEKLSAILHSRGWFFVDRTSKEKRKFH